MCVVILALFSFAEPACSLSRASTLTFGPRSSLRGRASQIDSNNLERELSIRLEQKYGTPQRLARIETAEDSSGEVSYVVYPK